MQLQQLLAAERSRHATEVALLESQRLQALDEKQDEKREHTREVGRMQAEIERLSKNTGAA
jgi:hypothetical protein